MPSLYLVYSPHTTTLSTNATLPTSPTTTYANRDKPTAMDAATHSLNNNSKLFKSLTQYVSSTTIYSKCNTKDIILTHPIYILRSANHCHVTMINQDANGSLYTTVPLASKPSDTSLAHVHVGHGSPLLHSPQPLTHVTPSHDVDLFIPTSIASPNRVVNGHGWWPFR